jgi:hypothetical protein
MPHTIGHYDARLAMLNVRIRRLTDERKRITGELNAAKRERRAILAKQQRSKAAKK